MADDDDIRALLAAARPDEGPPLGIDAAGIARRGRRIARRRRRWAVGATSVATLLVAGVLAGTLAGRAPEHVGPATGPSVTTTQRPVPDTSPRPVPGTPARPSMTASRPPVHSNAPSPGTARPDAPRAPVAHQRPGWSHTAVPGVGVPPAPTGQATPRG